MPKQIGLEYQALPTAALEQRVQALERRVAVLDDVVHILLDQLHAMREDRMPVMSEHSRGARS